MEDRIISSFDARYYGKAICGALLLLWCTGYLLYHCMQGDFVHPLQAYGLTLFLCGADWVYYYFFSKSWKRITITAAEIVVYDVVFKTQITIPYADITSVGAYRTRGEGGSGGLTRDFVIWLNNNRSVGFNEAWYDNYNKLTMAIYLHKYGPGHGRDRYLARH